MSPSTYPCLYFSLSLFHRLFSWNIACRMQTLVRIFHRKHVQRAPREWIWQSSNDKHDGSRASQQQWLFPSELVSRISPFKRGLLQQLYGMQTVLYFVASLIYYRTTMLCVCLLVQASVSFWGSIMWNWQFFSLCFLCLIGTGLPIRFL